jgi:hypothetical protein
VVPILRSAYVCPLMSMWIKSHEMRVSHVIGTTRTVLLPSRWVPGVQFHVDVFDLRQGLLQHFFSRYRSHTYIDS